MTEWNLKDCLRSSKLFLPCLFPVLYLQKFSPAFLFFSDNLFSFDKKFTVISPHVNNIFYSSTIRSKVFGVMWVFSHFIPIKQLNFCLCRGLIITLGNKAVLIYATGKTWVTAAASLITCLPVLSHLTLLGLGSPLLKESYFMLFQLIILLQWLLTKCENFLWQVVFLPLMTRKKSQTSSSFGTCLLEHWSWLFIWFDSSDNLRVRDAVTLTFLMYLTFLKIWKT